MPARAAGAGICCVMQWMLPPPSNISRVSTPTTSRVGNSRLSAGARTVPALVVERHHDAFVGDIEIDVGRRQPIAGPARGCRLRVDAAGLLGRHEQRPGLMDLVNREFATARIARLRSRS
jgi:hypothetical protein